jgi:hypothetical protein
MSPDHVARGSDLDNIYSVTLSVAAVTALTNLNIAYSGQVLILAYEDHVLANSDKDFNDLIFAFTPLQTSTQVPESTIQLLLGLGLVGVEGIRGKFKK